MRSTFLSFLLAAFNLIQAQNHFILKGAAPKEFEGKKLFLTIQDNYSLHKTKATDSTVIKEGSFYFTGIINKPCEWGYVSLQAGGFHYLIIDSGTSQIIINNVPANSTFYNNKLSNIIIRNAEKSNDIYHLLDSLTLDYTMNYGKHSADSKITELLDDNRIDELRKQKLKVL